jgi:hypothetical protein
MRRRTRANGHADDHVDTHRAFATTWEEIVKDLDMAALEAILEPEVVFRSPAVFTPYVGRETVLPLLANIIEVVPDLSYSGRYFEDDGRVMLQFDGHTEFKGRSIDVSGIDIFTLSDEGTVQELVVMLRPYRAMEAVMTTMGRRLAANLGWRQKLGMAVRSSLGLRVDPR